MGDRRMGGETDYCGDRIEPGTYLYRAPGPVGKVWMTSPQHAPSATAFLPPVSLHITAGFCTARRRAPLTSMVIQKLRGTSRRRVAI